jgi:uncharacterized protein YjiK
MSRVVLAAGVAACLVVIAGCQAPRDDVALVLASPAVVARSERLDKALADHDSNSAGPTTLAQWRLPAALKEISGLALTSDGRLLAHDDEVGAVWEIDYRRGVVLKRFSLGGGIVKGDFEGITVAHDMVYLLTSTSKLYEFQEGANDARVKYIIHDLGLKEQCEFEGVAFDPTLNALLLACKHVHNKALQGELVIYRWSLTDTTGARLSTLSVPLAKVIGANGWKGLHPSDITIDPLTGNYVLIASLEKAIVSITPAGAVVFARPLPPGHDQPEGVAITKDGVLIISDEARLLPALMTLYRWP